MVSVASLPGIRYNSTHRWDIPCYFYVVDEDFGPLFIKLSSYFPYTARISVNGHEYAKRQLAMEGIEFEALDNGILSRADPARLRGVGA